MSTYETILACIGVLEDADVLPSRPTKAQRIDWALGQLMLASPGISPERLASIREHLERTVEER